MSLDTREIAEFAYVSKFHFIGGRGHSVERWHILTEDEQALECVKAQEILLSAANPNGWKDVQKFHDGWLEAKLREGWKYGEWESEEMKTHPLLLPMSALPEVEKVKDFLFRNVVVSLGPLWSGI